MKGFTKYTLAAVLVAGAAASGSHHHHQHRHVKKQAGSKVEKREPDVVTQYVVGPTETVFQLGGQDLDAEAARAGLDGGDYVIVGESTPTYSPPPPPPPPTTSSSVVPDLGAQFIESKTSSKPAPTPSTTSIPKPTSTSSPPPPPKSTKSAKPTESSSDSSSGATGLDSDFPSGKIKCSEFPSKYGALPLDWLKLGKWSGLQFVPGYSAKSVSISSIITGIAGQTCSEGCMCSYACPTGYQKTQWPDSQGATKQSIGGLYCNSDGYLELTRSSSKKLCEPGAGGVSIQNDLKQVVSTCRTDYPGTESMTLPSVAEAGQQISICNPNQETYYQWDGTPTSAQYYVNKQGLGAKDACVWNCASDSKGCGNWAPLILGVGKAQGGVTFISLFPNLPTSHDTLDFNVEITGDVNSECSFIDGKYSGGSNGCTTGMAPGGKAVVRYFARSN